MRLKPIDPKQYTEQQKTMASSMEHVLKTKLKGFVAHDRDGALVGPFNVMLHFPQYGAAAWAYNVLLGKDSTLPKAAHEVAILVTGARFHSRYELYAHEHVAAEAGLSADQISSLAAGVRPANLGWAENIAYDVAHVLATGGQLPESTYRAAVKEFGETGTAELIYLIAGYVQVSVLLNAYDISVPGREENLPDE